MLLLKKQKNILGLDIGSKVTKAVQISFIGAEKPAIHICKMMPSGLLDEGFEGNLKTFLKDNKISTPLVACSVDDASIKIRKMELPKMPEADLKEAIKWNLRDLVEGETDNFIVNYSIISEIPDDDSAPMDIVAYAIMQDVIVEYKERLLRLGLEPFFIEPAAVTLASTLDRCHGDDDNYIAGINIGYKTSLFYVIGKRLFLFSRPMPGINIETQKKESETFNQKLGLEIQKSIDTFKVNFKMEDINHLYLSGGGATLPGLADYLKQNLGLAVDILNPFISLSYADTLDKDIIPSMFVQAVGLSYIQSQ